MGSESCDVAVVGGGVSTVRSAETGRDSAGGSCCRGSQPLLGTGKFVFLAHCSRPVVDQRSVQGLLFAREVVLLSRQKMQLGWVRATFYLFL